MRDRASRRRRAAGRDDNSIASYNFHTVQPYVINPLYVRPLVRSRWLSDIEDRRQWSPIDTPRTLNGMQFRRLRQPGYTMDGMPSAIARIGFADPHRVVLCVRRKRRREIIFALGVGGRKGRRTRKPRRNKWSEVRC